MSDKKSKAPLRQSDKIGMSPGTPVFIGEQRQEKVRVNVIEYSADHLEEHVDVTLEKCVELAQKETITWIDVIGIHDMTVVERLGKCLNLHPLTLEDIANTRQRPKLEEFPDYLFMVLKMVKVGAREAGVAVEHVSLILGENYVLSFQEQDGDVFDTVRNQLRAAKGRIRGMKSDYLAYVLMDTVVDHYFLAVEHLGDVIEEIDDRIVEDPRPEDMQEIHHLKRDIIALRKAVWPMREEVSALEKSESSLIHRDMRAFFRDLYDHTIQVIDMVETFRDTLGSMHDTYLSSISNRMNEIMKVLTIIATIFIPLTFVVGVYGMNFEYMPELKWHWGYFGTWAVMIVLALLMVLYFKRKKWL